MPRKELEKLLFKAVADALGVEIETSVQTRREAVSRHVSSRRDRDGVSTPRRAAA